MKYGMVHRKEIRRGASGEGISGSGSTVVKCRVVTTASIRSFMDIVVLIGFDTNRKDRSSNQL